MRTLDRMLERYHRDHTHPLNRATHMVGIPALLVALPVLAVRPAWGAGLLVFGAALQLLGHAFEGNAPSFVRDPRFVLVGAAWYAQRVTGWGRPARPVPPASLRYVVVGAGAVGSYVGGMLARAGRPVVLVGRGAHLGAVQRGGLHLGGLVGPQCVRIEATDSPAAVARADVVLLCVKSQDTAAAAAEIAPHLPPHAVVVSLQNGVQNVAMLDASPVGRGRSVAGAVLFNAVFTEPGRALLTTRGPVILGAGDDALHGPVIRALARDLAEAGLPTEVSPRIEGVLWSKLLINLGNGLGALTGQSTAEALADPVFRRLCATLLDEGLAAVERGGVALESLGALDPRRLRRLLTLPVPGIVRRAVARWLVRVHPEARSSTAQSLARGRPTEIDFLSGEIVRLAEAFGGDAPYNRAVRDLVLEAEVRPRRLTAADAARRIEAAVSGRAAPDHEVLVIGAGLAGLGAGIALQRAGLADFVILEKADEVGGTWKVNTYPGVAVDTNSFNYAYSSVPYVRWTRAYAPGAEVAAYAEHLADTYGLRDHVRFRTEVTAARFDERADLWRLSLAGGASISCRFLIHAPGGLTQPKRPDIPGLADFAGPVMHTAEWDASVALRGRRVAVIGTGASAVQVVPSIAPEVGHLSVFQRTPIWVAPKPDFTISPRARAVFERIPLAYRAARLLSALPSTLLFRVGTIHHRRFPWIRRFTESILLRHLRRQVDDPALRERLTPSYGFGCKRPVVSSDYLRAFNRPNVALVTDAVRRITARGLETADGAVHEVDVIVLATGFKVYERGNTPPYPVYGCGGLELGQFWHDHRYQAYEACTLPQWPNMFVLTAPYGLGGASYFTMVEASLSHGLRVMRAAWSRGATRAAVRQDAHDAYFAGLQRRLGAAVFHSGACAGANSYYFDHHGDAVAIRPHLGLEIWWHSRMSPLHHYDFDVREPVAAALPAARAHAEE
jgi:2-dehydropantoate 2-reductase